MPAPLEVISAVPTPFRDDGALDLGAFRRVLERIEPRVDGVLVAGTTGEFPALTAPEQASMVGVALEVFGTARVIAHIGAASTRHAVELLREASSIGAERFAAITPFYFPAPPDETLRYYSAIKDAAGDHEVYAYVFPDLAQTDLDPVHLSRLASIGLDGVKVSGRASERVEEYSAAAPTGFRVWSGNDADLARLEALHCAGTVSGVSAVCPEPWRRYQEAVAAGDAKARDAAQAVIDAIVPVLGTRVTYLKYALASLGLTTDVVRMSIAQPDSAHREAIAAAVRHAADHDQAARVAAAEEALSR
jgi:4-hydroxy-tetrahydrodipicolinate synthase